MVESRCLHSTGKSLRGDTSFHPKVNCCVPFLAGLLRRYEIEVNSNVIVNGPLQVSALNAFQNYIGWNRDLGCNEHGNNCNERLSPSLK